MHEDIVSFTTSNDKTEFDVSAKTFRREFSIKGSLLETSNSIFENEKTQITYTGNVTSRYYHDNY